MSQLIDWDRPGDLIVVIRDLSTDEVISKTAVAKLEGGRPVLVSLEYLWKRAQPADESLPE